MKSNTTRPRTKITGRSGIAVIEFHLPDLRGEVFSTRLISKLDLDENALHWTVRCYSEKPEIAPDANETGDTAVSSWTKPKLKHQEVYAAKSAVTAIGRCYVEDLRLWQVYFSVTGHFNDIEMYVYRESEAKDILERLARYLNFKK